MNYITEINAFNEYILLNTLSTGEVALWYALMHINNKTAWSIEFTVSNLVLQQLTSLSRSAVHEARKRLVSRGLIQYKSGISKNAGKYRINSLVCIIQDTRQRTRQDTEKDTKQDFSKTQDDTNTRHETSTLTKRKLKENINKDIIPPISPKDEWEITEPKTEVKKEEKQPSLKEQRFNEFWAAYPKKVDKKDTFDYWSKMKLTDELFETILKAIEAQKKSWQWAKDNGKYIISPFRWLKKAKWEDETETEVSNGNNLTDAELLGGIEPAT